MAEPISIQQLKDASEDAITLADFIYKPANVMIPRRLAADINSLQYYLDYMSSYAQHSYETYDEMVANAVNLPSGVSAFVTNDSDTTKNGLYTYNGVGFVKGEYQPEKAAIDYVEAKLGGLEVFEGKVRAQDVSTVDGSTQDIKNTEFRNELDALPFEEGVLADTFVNTQVDGVGAIIRTLQDKNSEVVTAADFGDNLHLVGEWLKVNKDRFCYLESGKSYTMPDGNNYCNRLVCKDGTATIICNENANLYYSDGAANILHLEGIHFVRYGRRTSINNATTVSHYSDGSAVVTSATLKNITYTTPSVVGNIDSWVDDTGKTRGGQFISYQVTKDSYLENVKSYGSHFFATIRSAADTATHTELNCEFHNCETGIYMTGTFSNGHSENVNLYNTKLNSTYYKDSNNDSYPNGCDVYMSEASHTSKYTVKNVFAENAIERSLYLISDNLYISDIHSVGGYDAANIKHDAATGNPSYTMKANNLSMIVDSDTAAGFRCNGYADAHWSNISITSEAKKDMSGINTTGGGKLVIDNLYAKNTREAVSVTGTISELEVLNSNFIDCGADSFSAITINTSLANKAGKITINNCHSTVSDIKDLTQVLSTYCYAGGNAEELVMRNCTFHGKKYPLYTGNNDKVSIHNTLFECASTETGFTFWQQMFNKREGTQDTNKATNFDFVVRHHALNVDIPTVTDVRFKRDSGGNSVPIVDHWHSADISLVVNTSLEGKGSNIFCPLSDVAVPSIWKVSASFKGSYLSFLVNNITKAATDIVVVGDDLSVVSSTTAIRVFYNYSSASLMVVAIPTSFNKIGDLKIRYERLA